MTDRQSDRGLLDNAAVHYDDVIYGVTCLCDMSGSSPGTATRRVATPNLDRGRSGSGHLVRGVKVYDELFWKVYVIPIRLFLGGILPGESLKLGSGDFPPLSCARVNV